jgi:antitoxin ParD1/3/4
MAMPVNIPPEFERFVQNAVTSGTFRDEAEVISEALRLLQERERRLEYLRQQIHPALERLDRGERIELNDETLDQFFERIELRGQDQHQ